MDKNVNLFVVSDEDLSQIIAIEKDSFVLLLPEGSFKDSLTSKDTYFKCLKNGEEVGAYLLATTNPYEGEIVEIAVKKEYRKLGYASMLLADLEKELTGREYLYLEVREDNIKAISLYEKLGFREYNIRKNYYRDGTNAILYRKKL